MQQKKRTSTKVSGSRLFQEIFGLSKDIRYVALLHNGKLEKMERPGLHGASSSESDIYEEIIVNPTLLTLLRQRGNIDCGGLQHVVIRYGNFFQFVHPLPTGHISVAFEVTCDYIGFLPRIEQLMKIHGLLSGSRKTPGGTS